jgi:hypothetical protein
MPKEKLVYVLNPDGLTESIFVAKGHPNEGQYRGKRYTKAGLKAEKKRQRDEALRQAESLKPQINEVTGLVQNEGDGLSYTDYTSSTVNQTRRVKSVKLHGSATGWIGIFNDKSEMIVYREFPESFKAKQQIYDILTTMHITNPNLHFYKNRQGIIVFKGDGELYHDSEENGV